MDHGSSPCGSWIANWLLCVVIVVLIGVTAEIGASHPLILSMLCYFDSFLGQWLFSTLAGPRGHTLPIFFYNTSMNLSYWNETLANWAFNSARHSIIIGIKLW